MKLDTTVIKLPGLSRKYTFYHTSDCHIAYAGENETEQAKEKARLQTQAWSYTGLLPSDAFDQVLRMADEDHVDGLFLCGDIADYLTQSNVDEVRRRLAKASVPLFYVCGNHERSGADAESSFYPFYEDMMFGSPDFWVHDCGEFTIVGMDDGDKQMRAEQLEKLQQQFDVGKPILLLIHIPILTQAIMPDVCRKWGKDGLDYFLLGQETELARRFCAMLSDPAAPVAAVFAGHIHLAHTGEIIPGRMQYTSAPAFEGIVRKYVLETE